MSLRDKITEQEYQILSKWRDWYGWQEERSSYCETKPIKDILEVWENNNASLYKLLDDNLILTKEIVFEKSLTEIEDEMYEIFDKFGNSHTRIEHPGWVFRESFRDWVEKTYFIDFTSFCTNQFSSSEEEEKINYNHQMQSDLSQLISYSTLSKNKYTNHTFTIDLPNGKTYRIQNGCKPLKPLAKIAEAFNLEGFEEFRICHSLVHNQKMLKGNLSLSIHPLDYWTMSDNESGWDSCMSWREYGSYRQGTVEMMNSPVVVVAYLDSSEPMDICDLTWNNKKWRCLFIVDKDVILSVKDYPYCNSNLKLIVLNWLKELAEKNMGWHYYQSKPETYDTNKFFVNPKYPQNEFRILFSTNNMYNDVSKSDHYIYLGENICSDESTIYFSFSGSSQCISCGKSGSDIDLDGEISLVCSDCETIIRCSCCGERVSDPIYVDGEPICDYCYDNSTGRCELCEEDKFKDDIMCIHYLLPLTEIEKELLDKKYPVNATNSKYEHAICLDTVSACNECINNMKKYLKPGEDFISYYNSYGELNFAIYMDQIQDEENFTMFEDMGPIEELRKDYESFHHIVMFK